MTIEGFITLLDKEKEINFEISGRERHILIQDRFMLLSKLLSNHEPVKEIKPVVSNPVD